MSRFDQQRELPGPRTRRGATILFAGLFIFMVVAYAVLLMGAWSKGTAVFVEVCTGLIWVTVAIVVGVALFSLIWIRYRLLALRLWISGVRGRYLVALVGDHEKLALASLFNNPGISALKVMGVVITVNQDGFLVWHQAQSKSLGTIPWSDLRSIRAVNAVRYSRESPELQFEIASLRAPISFAIVSVWPFSAPTFGLKRLEKLAATLRAEGVVL